MKPFSRVGRVQVDLDLRPRRRQTQRSAKASQTAKAAAGSGVPASSPIGGLWSPVECAARHRVALVVPYRDRRLHLLLLLRHLHPILRRQLLSYRIYVVEQRQRLALPVASWCPPSQTALLHVEGPQVPRFVYFYGGEMPCRDYQPTRQFCPICRTTGHRPDVCPNPTVRACNTSNHPNPEAGHTCVPKCALCGGAHLTAVKDCNIKLKRIPPRRKPASTTAPKTQRHPRPRWFSSEREDSDSDYSESSMTYRSRSGSSPRSRSRSCSRPRPHFRSPRRRSQSTPKQQQQGAPIIAAPKDKGSQQNQRKIKEASPKRTNTE
ncbi:hypothetical protein HPB49_024615 [Dermacentor silvarum]|uniref:Uncharacterized protein n=1 Tax=Dermacentor silvarum TaxID=543639 RepID=A0ACB8CCC4_DERSI|nr:hypothetical protein HPB49_024615 [Dermacentor silvarum]